MNDETYDEENEDNNDLDYSIDEENEIEDNEEYSKTSLKESLTNIPIGFKKNEYEHKKKMYFDNERITHLIVDVYQPSLKYDENGTLIERDSVAEKEIMISLFGIANAIINKYSYWRFDRVDDLQAECLAAMWKYLPRYVPGKGTAFNLFSILCKRHLLNFTLKNKKHRLTADIDICPEVSNKSNEDYDIFYSDIEKTFLNIIDRHFIKQKRKKYIELTAILMDYIHKNRKIVGKNDLLFAFREYGYKSSDYKKFIDDMKKYEKHFFELAS